MKELIYETVVVIAVILFVFLIMVEMVQNNYDKQSYLQPVYFTKDFIEIEKKTLELERIELRIKKIKKKR